MTERCLIGLDIDREEDVKTGARSVEKRILDEIGRAL